MKDNLTAYELLLKQHYQGLTPEEEAILESLLIQDPRLRELQTEIQNAPKEEGRLFLKSINPEEEFANVLQRAEAGMVTERNRKSKIRKIVAGVASTAALIALVISLTSRNNEKQEIVNILKDGSTLTLANGRRILIGDTGMQILQAGPTAIHNHNRSLTFETTSVSEERGFNTLYVPNKLDFKIILADGTEVWLNSTTKFRFPFQFQDSYREVYVESGEAYFNVAPNTKPFVVHTESGSVRVLGTEFNVNAYNTKKVITSLVSGKVSVVSGGQAMELNPGTEAIIQNGKIFSKGYFDQEDTLGWRSGVHYFESASLEEVGIMLKRWFDVELVIDNQGAAQTEIRGKLNRNQPLEVFIDQVNRMKVVTLYWEGETLHCK